jgi:hypothetical protein
MRAEPRVSALREDFTFYIYPNFEIPCQLYHTPGPARLVPRTPEPIQFSFPWSHKLSDLPTPPEETEIPIAPRTPAARPEPELIFTHGRGSTLDNPAIVAFSKGFARTSPVLCFHDTRPMTDRVTTFRALMQNFPAATAAGGRSMGSRASCRAALYSPIRKLIFFTYPLIRGLDERYEELLALPAEVDVLLIIGDEDAMAPELILKSIRARMRARTWWIRLVKADHAIWYDNPDTRDTICNVAGQIAATWNVGGNRDPALTELTIRYNATEGYHRVEWTEWMAPPPEPQRAPTQFNININRGISFGDGNFNFTL